MVHYAPVITLKKKNDDGLTIKKITVKLISNNNKRNHVLKKHNSSNDNSNV